MTVQVLDSIIAGMPKPAPTDAHDHEHDAPWWEGMVMPVLLDIARRRYGDEIRRSVTEAGYTDLPRRGARLIGGIARNGSIRQEDLPEATGSSKQATSQLIDTCVSRGYLERVADPDDRRRMIISLTDRGTYVAAVVRAAVDRVDAALVAALGDGGWHALRQSLGAMADMEVPSA